MMNEDNLPLVSVAIITYNQKIYLKECIESVLAQDYPNIEIVVADDGSTDGTQDMLKAYAERFPNKFILKLSEKNQGITHNSNVAHFACSGKYIAFVGGDDIFSPNKISQQVKFFENNEDYVLCGTYTYIIDEHSNIIGYKKDFKKKKKTTYMLCELIESGNGLVPVVSYMYRRSAAPVHGFDFRLPVASDSLFYYQVANKGKIWIVPEYLTSYRVHDSHAKRIGYVDDKMVSLALCEYYFPQCFNAIIHRKQSFFYSIGRLHHKKNEFRKARSYYKYALSHKVNLKTTLAYILALFKVPL